MQVPQEILRDYVLLEGRVDKTSVVKGAVYNDGSKVSSHGRITV